MLRVRFHIQDSDYRPVVWPIKYPYWCTGYGDNYTILVAFVDSIDQLFMLWPDASNINEQEVEKPTFSDRFPKPDWYDEAAHGN